MNIVKPWFMAQMSIGVVQWVSIALLLTPIIIERTESGTLLGSVMAVIGLFGIAAPLIGYLADKYSLHRLLQRLALVAHLVSLLLLYSAQSQPWLYLLIGFCIGAGTVTLLVLNPTFVLNGLPESLHGRGLSRLFQFQFAGIVIAGTLLGLVGMIGWDKQMQLMLLMGLVCLSLLAVTISPPPSINIAEQDEQDDAEVSQSSSGNGIAWILFLVTVFISMFTSSNLMETGPLIIKHVFNVELGHSAFGLAASALVTIVLLEPAGRWVEKSGPYVVWFTGLLIYTTVAVGLWLSIGQGVPSLLPILFLLLLMQAISWFDMVIPAIAERLSPLSPAFTQGVLLLAMAGGFGIGTFVAGLLIDAAGFSAVIAFCAGSIVLAILTASATLKLKNEQ